MDTRSSDYRSYRFFTVIRLPASRASKHCLMQIALITQRSEKKEERIEKSEGTTGAGNPIMGCNEHWGAFHFALDAWRLLRIG